MRSFGKQKILFPHNVLKFALYQEQNIFFTQRFSLSDKLNSTPYITNEYIVSWCMYTLRACDLKYITAYIYIK